MTFCAVLVCPRCRAAPIADSLSFSDVVTAGSVDSCAMSDWRPAEVTTTVKVAEREVVLPALSVEVAETVCVPALKDDAGAEMLVHVSVAIPERASLDAHDKVTCWSTVKVAPSFEQM